MMMIKYRKFVLQWSDGDDYVEEDEDDEDDDDENNDDDVDDDDNGDYGDDDDDESKDNFYCLVPKTERTENEKIWPRPTA